MDSLAICEGGQNCGQNQTKGQVSKSKMPQTWRTAAIAGAIGTVSLSLLFLTIPQMFLEYVVFPLVKDAYILPEWRYRIFDAVLVAWCIDGLVAAVLLFRSTATRPSLRPWVRRTMFFYFVG